ncbi:hypothetical protein [Paenibacillus mucilaginosus]|uniref:hypothetical protein n=1 Tax=Paenibacillus mucilaginosus TaxID=61624 RepID=UPI003B75C436
MCSHRGRAEEIIRSLQNPRVKQWTELQSRKGHEKTGRFLIEGHHLVHQALQIRRDAGYRVLLRRAA